VIGERAEKVSHYKNMASLGTQYRMNGGYSFGESASHSPLPSTMGRTGMLTASGVLLIIGSAIALTGGLFAFYVASLSPLYYYYFHSSDGIAFTVLTIVGIFGILGFAAGLTSGVQCLRRKHFALSFSGAALLLMAGVLHFVATEVFPYGGSAVFALFFGTPITILTVLGLLFLALRKSEFL
jgi:hypothetical protein